MNTVGLMTAANTRLKQLGTAPVPTVAGPFEYGELIFAFIQVEK